MRLVPLGLLCVLVSSPPVAYGQWAVEEVGPALVQQTISAFNAVATAANTANTYIRQGEQLINEYNILVNQVKQYETMIANLKRIPEGLNFFETISAYGTKLTGLLGQANAIGYDLNDATKQFTDLYDTAVQVSDGDYRKIEKRFQQARLQASGVAIQVQSIRETSTTIFDRLCKLLDGSWKAEGNLDSQQIAAQQAALRAAAEQQTQALQATGYRLQAMKDAEEIARQRLRTQVREQFTAPVAVYAEDTGFLPTYRWTDQ